MFYFLPKLSQGKCPVCGGELHVGRLCCDVCRAEYPVNEALLPYERLSPEELNFLKQFLICGGNFKTLGDKQHLGLSYPTVKKKYAELLQKLGFVEDEPADVAYYSDVDVSSKLPSDIVMQKLMEVGGIVQIPTLEGSICTIKASVDENGEKCFISDKLNNYTFPYSYSAFDIIVDFLKSSGGKAKKGCGRSAKVGEAGCTPDTVIGNFAVAYFGKRDGESTYDPIFVFAAILDWAGIARNRRGYLELYD